MLQIREAYIADAEAIAALLTELGYPALITEFYHGLGFESRSRKFVRSVHG